MESSSPQARGCTPDCCAPERPQTTASAPLLFGLVLVATAGAIAWSTLHRAPAAALAGPDSGPQVADAREEAAGEARDVAQVVGQLEARHDVVFAIVPSSAPADALEARVASLLSKLTARGLRTQQVTVDPTAPGFAAWAGENEVTALPAVVILGKKCGTTTVSGDVSTASLAQAYAGAAASPGRSCGTPSACGSACASKCSCSGDQGQR